MPHTHHQLSSQSPLAFRSRLIYQLTRFASLVINDNKQETPGHEPEEARPAFPAPLVPVPSLRRPQAPQLLLVQTLPVLEVVVQMLH